MRKSAVAVVDPLYRLDPGRAGDPLDRGYRIAGLPLEVDRHHQGRAPGQTNSQL